MKKFVLALLVVTMLLGVVSCSAPAATPTPVPAAVPPTKEPTKAEEPTPKAAQKYAVALVPPALVSPFYIDLSETAKAEAAKNPDIVLTVTAPAVQTDIEGQVKIVEDLIQKKVNLIAIATSNWPALTPVLQKARQAGIEVVLVDRVVPVEGLDAISGLGSDEIEGGRFVAELVTKLLNGKGKVAILAGVTGSYHAEQRTAGFNEVISKESGIQVVTTQPANWQRELGMTTMENILQANKDLDIVWGQNDNMALGALQAIEAAGLQDKVKVIGYNGDKEALENVKSGRLVATMKSQPVEIGKAIIDEIVPLLIAGKRSEVKSAYPIHVVPVTKDNVDQYVQ